MNIYILFRTINLSNLRLYNECIDDLQRDIRDIKKFVNNILSRYCKFEPIIYIFVSLNIMPAKKEIL